MKNDPKIRILDVIDNETVVRMLALQTAQFVSYILCDVHQKTTIYMHESQLALHQGDICGKYAVCFVENNRSQETDFQNFLNQWMNWK